MSFKFRDDSTTIDYVVDLCTLNEPPPSACASVPYVSPSPLAYLPTMEPLQQLIRALTGSQFRRKQVVDSELARGAVRLSIRRLEQWIWYLFGS